MSYAREEANQRFSRARMHEMVQKMLGILNPGSQELLSLREVRDVLRPRGESYRGLQAVPVDRIVGSEGRYRDFNKRFLPRYEHLRSRWTRVDEAHIEQTILPPIRLYEIGGVYFVRDGNHRVSVARSEGAMSIDAEVVSLDSKVTLDPDLTREKLLQAVLGYEQHHFYLRTRFDKLFPEYDICFTTPGRYDELMHHIEGHKYYLNQSEPNEIPFERALRSWFDTVFLPIVTAIREHRLLGRFPGRTEADLYVWLVNHWDALKSRYGGDYPVEEAARDFSSRFGRSIFGQIGDAWRRMREQRERRRRIARGEVIDE